MSFNSLLSHPFHWSPREKCRCDKEAQLMKPLPSCAVIWACQTMFCTEHICFCFIFRFWINIFHFAHCLGIGTIQKILWLHMICMYLCVYVYKEKPKFFSNESKSKCRSVILSRGIGRREKVWKLNSGKIRKQSDGCRYGYSVIVGWICGEEKKKLCKKQNIKLLRLWITIYLE